ncbi:aminotransferase class IV [Lysinibacter sp. HNR]|uniref:aminotransferase class IV n=1 Tax=Lysinibacter sp. HNR TaxID=3031408 RepID=UPI002434E788|nr:aminotransferase class IV [Lysinibacter sp. HNR]WGD38022.1 aminotransferase class IV [Lysinibacter sp. HNR]
MTGTDPVLIFIDRAERGGEPPLFRQVSADEPQISVFDLGITRGDGIFESIGVFARWPLQLAPHIERLNRSARMLDLPELDDQAVETAITMAVEALPPLPEILVKIVVTRGLESASGLTTWVIASDNGDYSRERTVGLRAITLDRGYRSDVAETSPWLLQGAKTLSYAVNKAVLREAARRGAEEVIFISSDDYVLEGPASSLIVREGNTLITPVTSIGILPGTTQQAVFSHAAKHGLDTEYARLRTADLARADALWMVSSGRLVVPLNRVNETPVPVDAALTQKLLADLLAGEE